MNDVVDATECHVQPIDVAHVTDEITQPTGLGAVEALLHLVLLQFIPGEDDQPIRLVGGQHAGDQCLPERAGSAGDQYRGAVEIEVAGEMLEGTRFLVHWAPVLCSCVSAAGASTTVRAPPA